MSEPYEETIDGLSILRLAPGARHEEICRRLHVRVAGSLASDSVARLLPPRTAVALNHGLSLRPDLALVTVAHGRLWLAAEIVNSHDHEPDTVMKKTFYEDLRVPRLWMIDPRYDNVEVYHATEYGLMLKGILAGDEALTEKLLPGFAMTVRELFGLTR